METNVKTPPLSQSTKLDSFVYQLPVYFVNQNENYMSPTN